MMGALIDAVLTAFVVMIAMGGLLYVIVCVLDRMGDWAYFLGVFIFGMVLLTMALYYS